VINVKDWKLNAEDTKSAEKERRQDYDELKKADGINRIYRIG
jgi:hypothetical protein